VKTCATCADAACAGYGTQQPGCDDWTSKLDDLPEDKPLPDPLAELEARFARLELQLEGIMRAVAAFTKAFTEA